MNIHIKRIYEPFADTDGYRILVDRLWPRGVKKENAHVDKWMKDVAPSTNLRKWFDHDAEKWDEFCLKYHSELKGSAAVNELMACLKEHKQVTLLYAAKSEKYNHALALQQFMKNVS